MIRRWPRTAIHTAALLLLISAAAVRAEDPIPLLARLKSSDTGTALDDPALKPWHLKMTVQLFDEKGKPSDQGTIEEWWSAPGLDRREYKTAAYTATEIRSAEKVYRTQGKDSPPYYLGLLRRQVVHPVMPAREDPASIKPELRKLNVGKISLDCIAMNHAKSGASSPLGSSPTYCLDPGANTLRMTLLFRSEAIARNSIGRFQGREIPSVVVVSTNNVTVASEHVESLLGETIAPSEFEPSADLTEVVPPLADLDTSLPETPAAIAQRQPIYPEGAKGRHLAGTVVLRAIIGTNGSIRDLELVSSSDPVFVSSATTAVKQWKYKPLVLNGQPTEVETTILTTYDMGN
jgi:TonB family protein